MKTIHALGFLAFLVITSCTNEKISRLSQENDSLRQQIEHRNDMLIAMSEVNSIADSILNRHGLGTAPRYQQYLDRIEFLHRHLMLSEDENEQIGKDLHAARDEAMAYSMMVMALQDEVTIRDGEISDGQKALLKDAQKHKGTVSAMEKAMAEKDEELRRLKVAIDEIKRMNAAESYFIRAQRLEQKARRIVFAQRKKQENYREALELYQQSLLLGKAEAAVKIVALRKLI